MWSAGIIIGSSEMGLTKEEYDTLSEQEREIKCKEVEEKFKNAGADFVFKDIEEVVDFVLNTRK